MVLLYAYAWNDWMSMLGMSATNHYQ